MAYFHVALSVNLPYPINETTVIKASSFGTAIARAWRQMRKNPRFAGKRINEITVKAFRSVQEIGIA